MSVFYYNTTIGKIGIREENEHIINIYFENSKIDQSLEVKETPLIKETIRQIRLYLEGNLKEFNIPVHLIGTEYMVKVWNILRTIPYGNTVTYKEVAIKSGNTKASRAVGQINNRNPIPLIIPCHRVIGTNGKLVGFAGGLDVKEKLLEIERINKNNV